MLVAPLLGRWGGAVTMRPHDVVRASETLIGKPRIPRPRHLLLPAKIFPAKNSGKRRSQTWRPTMEDRYKSLLGITLPLTPKKINRLLFSFSIPRRFRGDREVLTILLDQQATFDDCERASAMYHQAFSPTAGRKTTYSYAHRRLAFKRSPNRILQRRIKPRSHSGEGQS